MSFVTRSRQREGPESPEALFRELRPTNPNVRDLLLRQGDALRVYKDGHTDDADVAIELPTGGGKTLVGLLVGEWRRRALGQRVAYLCPTVQLARQAAAKAAEYGIDTVTLVRSQADWDAGAFNRFQRGEVLAIAGYSQVFNSNPRLNSAQTLVLDDAHAGEDAVASNWSIAAPRQTALYGALLAAVSAGLDAQRLSRLRDDLLDPRQRRDVELVPPETVLAAAPDLSGGLSAHATGESDHNRYARASLGEALPYCLMYVSWEEIVLRPMIAPTADHPAFADAQQRVYMSATLRSSGDLERAFGVTGLSRIQVPAAGDEQGFGRRFFLMPGGSHGGHDTDRLIRDTISEMGRVLMLAPSEWELGHLRERCVPADTPILDARDVEHDFSTFTGQSRAALLLANRYDGIDLPGDSCRLVVLSGLPAATNAQERFWADSLGARRVLGERIRTRIVQGVGRCTRSARDFAAVIVRGDRLVDFLARNEELEALPPQLQAEIEFGFQNSENPDEDLPALLRHFFDQDADWTAAEEHLRSDTATRQRHAPAVEQPLAHAADCEVECWRAACRGDLTGAVDLAQQVTDRLIGPDDLRPYRALWFYLAASWSAHLAIDDPGGWRARAEQLRTEAEGAAGRLRWRPRFAFTREQPATPDEDPLLGRGLRAADRLRKLGIRGGRFEQYVAQWQAQLASNAATDFEEGLRGLGELLGFEAVRPSGQAEPDSAWRDDQRLWLLFEAKTEERPDTPLSVDTVRQALTHQEWVSKQLGWSAPERALTTVVTYKTTVDGTAASLAGELRIVSPNDVRAIARRALEAIREVRLRARGLSEDQMPAAMATAFRARQLDEDVLLAEVGERHIADG